MLAYLDQRRRLAPEAASLPDGGEKEIDLECAEEGDAAAAEEDLDFGGIVRTRPLAVLSPGSAEKVAAAVCLAARSAQRLTVAPRGNGHSVAGQAMAEGGIVLDMRAVSPGRFELVIAEDGEPCADVPGGALWEEVLQWGVAAHGLAPASWTDYLRLTVGGTLSNGGISGQAFRHGPQISLAREMEIVTGNGERQVCSQTCRSELFFAALGGLGQFGVITRARVALRPAPPMVKWIRVVYGEFETYSRDAEWLVNRPEFEAFDYVEGFAFVNRDDPADGWGAVTLGPDSGRFDPGLLPAGSGHLLYCLELALHCNHRDDADKRASEMLRPLRYVRGLEFTAHVSYVSFLSRVGRSEEEARANGSWHAPHPWLNILVSAADIAAFDRHVFKKILRDGIGGPMLVYPMLRSKWDPRTSVAVPESEVFYLVALLRFSRPFPEGPAVEELVAQNREIIRCCESNGYDYKMYLPHYESEAEWARHFGKQWPRFVDRKAQYDPMAILTPGQKIFSPRGPPPLLL